MINNIAKINMVAREKYNVSDFGKDFHFGVATAAYQIEGAWNEDGKGESIWDRFTHTPGKIMNNDHGDFACDFYHKYPSDIEILNQLNIRNNRFSIAWSRIKPQGYGKVNQKGIDYYNRVIDTCLEKGITPWLTCYHWDLPQNLQELGGWTIRQVVDWFEEYVDTISRAFGDRVKNWMVLNEPVAFTTLGYLLGLHAPGQRKPRAYFATVHHAALCQALGAKIIRENVKGAEIGTTISCSYIEPWKSSKIHVKAARRMEAFLNKLFIEPALGMGYPVDDFPNLKRIHKFYKEGDEERLKFDFDFWGIQYYTRAVVKYAFWVPIIQANLVKPEKLGNNNKITEMNWEVYPDGLYQNLKFYSKYKGIKKLIVTENGSAFPDKVTKEGRVHDTDRTEYLKDHIYGVLKAKQEGVPLHGYFIWTFMDNFEWAEGYHPRFGIVYNDFGSQKRYIKDSGYWMRDFLAGQTVE